MADEVKKDAAPEVVAEVKEEAAAPEVVAEEETVEVPAKFKKLVDEIDAMPVLELHELVKVLENKFGVSAAAVAVAGPAAGGEAEEKSEFDVVLTGIGESKIGVMKVVKEILGLGLKDAKELVEGVPATLKEAASKEEAEEMKGKIEEAGGSIELK